MSALSAMSSLNAMSAFMLLYHLGLQYVGPEIDAMAAVASAHEESRDRDVMHSLWSGQPSSTPWNHRQQTVTNSSRMSRE